RGLPAETVLRCALLKQERQLSYQELAFHLEASASFRAFARLPLAWSPKKSVLHQTISAIRPETWEAVNRAVLASAKQDRLESGATVRIDSTVTAALMHEPSDSALLWDAVRIMTALAASCGVARSAGTTVARSPAPGQEARASDRVQPRQRQPAPALSGADRRHPRHPSGTARGRRTAGRPRRDRGRALARPTRPLSAADRAHPRPEPAARP